MKVSRQHAWKVAGDWSLQWALASLTSVETPNDSTRIIKSSYSETPIVEHLIQRDDDRMYYSWKCVSGHEAWGMGEPFGVIQIAYEATTEEVFLVYTTGSTVPAADASRLEIGFEAEAKQAGQKLVSFIEQSFNADSIT